MVETAIKEKPILFSTLMVKAILEGRKNQTRRVLKLRKGDTIGNISDSTGVIEYIICGPDGDEVPMEFVSPYGVWGDRLWIREGFATEQKFDDKPMSFFDNASDVPIWYKADDIDYKNDYVPRGKWRPSIFIPRWASRINLEVTDVIIQRLQDISEDDAIAEGVGFGWQMNAGWPDYKHIKDRVCTMTQDTAKASYATLWNSINTKRGYSWESNPWVWAVNFKKI